jgi:transcriptional regulator with XRE-family HTH domain
MKRQTTDFSKVLEALRATGLNDYRMAALTGIERSMLSKLRSGARKQPSYDDGSAIMAIYRAQAQQ